MVKYYLAHPILLRHKVREQELEFEKRTGIELVNPFYDGPEKDIIGPLDRGEITMGQYTERLNRKAKGDEFVLMDLENIQQTDGVVAVIQRGVTTIGTSMEIWHAFAVAKKPVYIVTDFPGHIWLRFVVERSDGATVKDFKELARLFKKKAKPR